MDFYQSLEKIWENKKKYSTSIPFIKRIQSLFQIQDNVTFESRMELSRSYDYSRSLINHVNFSVETILKAFFFCNTSALNYRHSLIRFEANIGHSIMRAHLWSLCAGQENDSIKYFIDNFTNFTDNFLASTIFVSDRAFESFRFI